MTDDKVGRLIGLIDNVVNEKGKWQDKRKQVLELCAPVDIVSLEEFCSWFERMPDQC